MEACSICGVWHKHGQRCKESTLRRIDAANTAAVNADDPTTGNIAAGFGRIPEGQRLTDGFALQRLNGDDP